MSKVNESGNKLSGSHSELKSRLFFVLGALIVYRIGSHIPVPGIDPKALTIMFEQQSGSILDMFNMFSGGALMRLSLFALGIMPYISASIIMQLMTVVIPSMEQLKKEGESGRIQLIHRDWRVVHGPHPYHRILSNEGQLRLFLRENRHTQQ